MIHEAFLGVSCNNVFVVARVPVFSLLVACDDVAYRLEDVMPREEDSAPGDSSQEGSSEISAAVDNGKGKAV